MLLTIAAWLYISFSCAVWGSIMLYSIKRLVRETSAESLDGCLICLLGFIGITVFASILSLVMPLGGWVLQIILFFLTIAFLFFKPTRISLTALKRQFQKLHPALMFFLLCCIVLLLVMSTWTINHPDTLTYHAQTIQWIEKYRVVPGLANLHIRYGLQSPWFISCAIFSTHFINGDALTFINSTILLWYFIFTVQQTNRNLFSDGNKLTGVLWMVLIAISLASYTQVRLTATSASLDFIAVLLTWAVLFLMVENKTNQNTQWLLVVLFSIFAITLKLSVLPLILTVVYAIYKSARRRLRVLAISCIIAVLVTAPYFARNLLTSGYLFFPSSFPDIVNVDWKVNQAETQIERDYITAYARIPVSHTGEDIKSAIIKPYDQWIPMWWKRQSVPDKILLLITALVFFVSLGNIRRIIRSDENTKAGLIISLTGCLFWFTQAPDPRFGFGFLIGFSAIAACEMFIKSGRSLKISSNTLVVVCTLLVSLAIGLYDVYRFKNFFSIQQLFQPLGVKKVSVKTIQCNGFDFRVPSLENECGANDIPCIYENCNSFTPRGNNLTDGFKSANK